LSAARALTVSLMKARRDFRSVGTDRCTGIDTGPAFAVRCGWSRGRKRAPFLLLPGSAPNERGRVPARRTLSKQLARRLPDCPLEAERWLPILGWAIHLRRPARSGRPKAGSAGRSGADGSQWRDTFRGCAGKVVGTVSAARPHPGRRCGNWFPLGWGVERPAAERTGSNRGRVARLFPAKRKKPRKV